MKNALLKALCAPFAKPPMGNHQKVLVVSTTGLGDTLWGTPAIRALKKISVLTSPIGAQVLKNSPFIDQFFISPDPLLPSIPGLLASLRKEKFDTALIFHTSQRPVLPLITAAGIPNRIATTGINKGLDSLLTDAIAPIYEHEIARRLRLASHIGVRPVKTTLDWFITDEEREDAAPFLPLKKPTIALHPGSKDAFKQWAPENFIAVGRQLTDHGFHIIVTGNAQEIPLAESIASKISGAISVAGKLPLRPFAALLENVDLMITNDTGPMHMAFALDVPTIALFGPTDPNLCGPYHAKNAITLGNKRPCTPCLKRSCLAPFCMQQIGVEDVITHAKRFYIEK